MSLSPESRAIIESARGGENLSRDHRARLRRRVMAQVLTGAAITAGTSAATQVASAATLSFGVKIGAALVVAGAVGWGAQQALEPAPLPALGGSAYVVERATESAVASAEVREETPPAPAIAPSAPQASAAPTPSPRTLSEEMALLQEAQRELQAGHADRALAVLQQHEQRYAAGALTEERDAARVLALCRLGRVDEARSAAERFATRFPRSPHRTRVLTACAAR